MNNMEIEQADGRRREQSLRKLDQQIRRIECLIKELLDGVDISELTTEKRLVIGARFVTLHQRAVALRHTFELDHPEVRENLEVARLMRLMRGEPEIETNEAVCIVDATDEEQDGDTQEEKLYTLADAALSLGVTEDTISRWLSLYNVEKRTVEADRRRVYLA